MATGIKHVLTSVGSVPIQVPISTAVWYSWNASSTNTTSSSSDVTWNVWTSGTSNEYQVASGEIWKTWTSDNTTGDIKPLTYDDIHYVFKAALATIEETEQERIERVRAAEERRLIAQRLEDERQKVAKERAEAKARAKEFLLELLDEQQKKDLLERDLFYVIDRLGRTWKIENRETGNLSLVDNGHTLKRLCVVFQDCGLPIYDLLAAQKLTLEANPEEIERVGILQHYRSLYE